MPPPPRPRPPAPPPPPPPPTHTHHHTPPTTCKALDLRDEENTPSRAFRSRSAEPPTPQSGPHPPTHQHVRRCRSIALQGKYATTSQHHHTAVYRQACTCRSPQGGRGGSQRAQPPQLLPSRDLHCTAPPMLAVSAALSPLFGPVLLTFSSAAGSPCWHSGGLFFCMMPAHAALLCSARAARAAASSASAAAAAAAAAQSGLAAASAAPRCALCSCCWSLCWSVCCCCCCRCGIGNRGGSWKKALRDACFFPAAPAAPVACLFGAAMPLAWLAGLVWLPDAGPRIAADCCGSCGVAPLLGSSAGSCSAGALPDGAGARNLCSLDCRPAKALHVAAGGAAAKGGRQGWETEVVKARVAEPRRQHMRHWRLEGWRNARKVQQRARRQHTALDCSKNMQVLLTRLLWHRAGLRRST